MFRGLFAAAVAAVCLVGSPSESRAEQLWDWDGETFSFGQLTNEGAPWTFQVRDGDYDGRVRIFKAKSLENAAGIARSWIRGQVAPTKDWYYFPPQQWNGFEVAPETYWFTALPNNSVYQLYGKREHYFTMWVIGGGYYMIWAFY